MIALIYFYFGEWIINIVISHIRIEFRFEFNPYTSVHQLIAFFRSLDR